MRGSSEVVSPRRGDIGRHHPLRLGRVRRHLERPMGWKSGVCEGFQDSGRGESGKDQTGVWRSFDEGQLSLTTTSGYIARS